MPFLNSGGGGPFVWQRWRGTRSYSWRRMAAAVGNREARSQALRTSRQAFVFCTKAVCFAKLVQDTVVEVQISSGPSMLPTFAVRDELAVCVPLPAYRKVAPYLPADVAPAFHHSADRQGPPGIADIGGPRGKLDPAMGTGIAVGDLVVIPSYNYTFDDACKRVIGLAGDTILINPTCTPGADHRSSWIQSKERAEQNEHNKSEDDGHPDIDQPQYVVVPPGHVWVGGDNLSDSTDSRTFGPLPLGVVKGRVVAKFSPFQWLPNGLKPLHSEGRREALDGEEGYA